jgi:hypothetical protein
MMRDLLTNEKWDEIELAAAKYQIDPDFLAAIILAESGGDWSRWAEPVHAMGQLLYPYTGVLNEDFLRAKMPPSPHRDDQTMVLAHKVSVAMWQVDYWRIVAERVMWSPGASYISGDDVFRASQTRQRLKEERDAAERDSLLPDGEARDV